MKNKVIAISKNFKDVCIDLFEFLVSPIVILIETELYLPILCGLIAGLIVGFPFIYIKSTTKQELYNKYICTDKYIEDNYNYIILTDGDNKSIKISTDNYVYNKCTKDNLVMLYVIKNKKDGNIISYSVYTDEMYNKKGVNYSRSVEYIGKVIINDDC